ncbi:SixA phosphatase family protein [Aestuariirhabdus litorea]|uniref:Phosphohistidine phosphatase SixA n=1 Tax=Aestuariirhabdus litorea TaxID=2528527 RepID=A0A3P3VW43_9GAMM|nr:histidine phosphatase family protein [Aestuariirhabdus litorea]RRJ84943.1 phosphohistidine phosphatase SixA [Aestuariirhabdus litorea]RWW98168.1 phosphohistidine phosphatase SixA [Endozoicomonadaceae bacterium GTF-13]
MSTRLLLMRHGEAEAMVGKDEDRALTALGEQQVIASAGVLAAYGVQRILASPYKRAQQTAALVGKTLGTPFTTSELLVPEADPASALQTLPLEDEVLLLVCHMPLVSRMAGWLVEGEGAWGPGFGTADVAVIEAEWVGPGLGVMRAMLGPRGHL